MDREGYNVRRHESSFFKTVMLFCATFVVVFVNRIFGFIDVSFLLLVMFFLSHMRHQLVIPTIVQYLVMALLLLFTYSLFITLVYGVNEIIWSMKFGRTCVIVFLLYCFYLSISKYWSYEQFKNKIILIVVFHSILIYFMFASEPVRTFVYGITGFEPRGPSWSRSPGITVSYNATAIVHMAALFFVVRSKKSLWLRLLTAALILPSLIFLGRSMVYLGLLMITLYMLIRSPIRMIIIGTLIVSLLAYLMEATFEPQTIGHYFSINLKHTLNPLLNYGTEKGVENYASTVLGPHIYFSEDWKVLLFGNSNAGHMAIFGSIKGETGSDLGVINSINGNGIIVTVIMYFLYFYLVSVSRRGDWMSIGFIVALTLALTFKETGFFTSHATPLLLLMVYYQLGNNKGNEAQLSHSIVQRE